MSHRKTVLYSIQYKKLLIKKPGYVLHFDMFTQLKLASAIFYQIFIFSRNDNPSKTENCFLFHLKSSFLSRDIQIFVIFLFLSALSRHKRTNESGITYDVMIGLYKFACRCNFWNNSKTSLYYITKLGQII